MNYNGHYDSILKKVKGKFVNMLEYNLEDLVINNKNDYW